MISAAHSSDFRLDTLSDALTFARALKLDSSDAAILISTLLGISRAVLLAFSERKIDAAIQPALRDALQRRSNGEPVAYILGFQEFFGLRLSVSAAVLIPRADTETLVQGVLDLALAPNSRVLDLGTGSGAIALALKAQRPDLRLLATDASEAALSIARQNSAALGLPVQFLCGNWFDALNSRESGTADKFAAIVSNPPYIAEHDPHLQQGDLRFEPASALWAAQQGMADLLTLCQYASDYLQPHGALLLEHGYDQASAVRAALTESGFVRVSSLRDLSGIERVSLGFAAVSNKMSGQPPDLG